jgi:uncharacterized OB-fold protein
MSELVWPKAFPAAVARLEDEAFWDSVQHERMALQRCSRCGTVRYPAADHCPECLSPGFKWLPLSGRATLVSWCTFHRQYLEAFPPPHIVAVGRLAEGPLFTAILLDGTPKDGESGAPLRIVYIEDPSGRRLPAFRRDDAAGAPST